MATDQFEGWSRAGFGAWTGINWSKDGGWPADSRLDPYLVWADMTAFEGMGGLPSDKDPTIPILMETSLNVLEFAWFVYGIPEIYEGLIELPDSALDPAPGAENVHFSSARVSREFLIRYAAGDWWLTVPIRRFQLALPVTVSEPVAVGIRSSPLILTVTPPKVVVGVIDDGLAFANASVSSRIAYFWNQDDNNPANVAPPGFGYGSEYGPVRVTLTPPVNQHRMREWNDAATSGGTRPLDEEALYQIAGLMQLRRHGTHGTATMEIATRGIARCAIVCVQLPALVTKDTSGASLGAYVVDGLHYLLARASDLRVSSTSTELPVVANLSYGNIAGPHDGSSILECAIDELVQDCNHPSLGRGAPFAVVIPSGNFYPSRCHARFKLEKKDEYVKQLTWRVHPNDLSRSFLEIWLPSGHNGQHVRIAVAPPGLPFGPDVGIGNVFVWLGNSTSPLCTMVFPVNSTDSTTRKQIFIALEPTDMLGQAVGAPAGAWRVRVTGDRPLADIDAWIQRDDTPFGYPRRGRQSYFEDRDYAKYNRPGFPCVSDSEPAMEGDPAKAFTRREGTLSAIATGTQSLITGGYRRVDMKPSRYSSCDTIRPPLCAAVCEDSAGHRGILTSGTHSGSGISFSGTSVAAPQLVRALAKIWQSTPVAISFDTKLFSLFGLPEVDLAPDTNVKVPTSVKGPINIYPPLPADSRLGYGLLGVLDDRFGIARLESDRT